MNGRTAVATEGGQCSLGVNRRQGIHIRVHNSGTSIHLLHCEHSSILTRDVERIMCRQLFLIVSIPAFVFAADDQAKKTTETAVVVKPGPDDPKEKVKPGPIDKDAPKTFKTTKSGLRYRILRKSDQAKPEESHMADIHFKGWLDNKSIFQSSYRSGKKKSYPVDRVIPGWTEGLQLVGKGGMIELVIPPKLGYGKRGMKVGKKVQVPPNSQLHFIIELFDSREEITIF